MPSLDTQARVDTQVLDDELQRLFSRMSGTLTLREDRTRVFHIDSVDYVQEQVLGNTRTSSTYLVHDGDNRQHVIKQLKEKVPFGFDSSKRDESLEKFQREARVLGQLKHPQIPKLEKCFVAEPGGETNFYMVMEYCEGATLESLLGKPMEPKQAIDIMFSLTDPVAYCHSQKPAVKHRDIKPANVIWYGTQAKLVDFGIVLDEEAGARGRDTISGTPGYMAPEQWWGKADERSDIYGMGTTLLHMLTGVAPSQMMDETSSDPARKFHVDYTMKVGHLEEKLREILGKCLAFEPEKRYGSVAELRSALWEYLAPALKVVVQPPREKTTLKLLSKIWNEVQATLGIAGFLWGLSWGFTPMVLPNPSTNIHSLDESEVAVIVDTKEGTIRKDTEAAWYPAHRHFNPVFEYNEIAGVDERVEVRMWNAEKNFEEVLLRGYVQYEIKDVESVHRLYGTIGDTVGQKALEMNLSHHLKEYIKRTFSETKLEDYHSGSRNDLANGFQREVSSAVEIVKFEILRE